MLKDNGLTYQDLAPYTLVMKLPVQAKIHNAKFFDLKNYVYIREISLGAPFHVNLEFAIKLNKNMSCFMRGRTPMRKHWVRFPNLQTLIYTKWWG